MKSCISDYKNTPKDERKDLLDYKYLLGNLKIDFSNLDAYTIDDLKIEVYNIQDDLDTYANFVNDSINYDPSQTDDNNRPLPIPKYNPVEYKKVPDMLDYTGKCDGKVADVSVDFSPKFNGALPSSLKDGEMIAVDVLISKCQPNYSNIDNLFLWGDNNSLVQAIRLTMQQFKPEGKILYRYYIRN